MIDYEKILKAYIAHIIGHEGIDYLIYTSAKNMKLTEAEFEALQSATEQQYGE